MSYFIPQCPILIRNFGTENQEITRCRQQVFVTLFDELDLRAEMSDFGSVKISGKLGYETVVFYWTRWCPTSSYPPSCRILFEFVVFYSIFQVFRLLEKMASRKGHTMTCAARKHVSYEQLISPDRRKKWRLSPSHRIQKWRRFLFIMNKI